MGLHETKTLRLWGYNQVSLWRKREEKMTNNKEQRIVKGYDDIEKALRRAEDTKKGIWY